jgi:hypothetical protein
MSARYEPVGTWREDWRVSSFGAFITIQVCDLRDTRTGTVYTDGCHRVVINKSDRVPATGQPRTKTFKGEMAWCNAERYAEDARNWYQRRRLEAGSHA